MAFIPGTMARAFAKVRAALVLAALLAAACTPVYRNHGYIPAEDELAQVTVARLEVGAAAGGQLQALAQLGMLVAVVHIGVALDIGLVHHVKAVTVGQLVDVRIVGIVRGAHRIDAERHQPLEPPFIDGQRHRHAERSAICMDRHALQLDVAAIEPESARRLESGIANAEGDALLIEQLPVGRADAQQRLTGLLSGFIERLGELTDSTSSSCVPPGTTRRTKSPTLRS